MTTSNGTTSSGELREAIARHDAAALARQQRADARRAELEARLAEAELREHVAEARSRLLADALQHEQEAGRLDALARERAEDLAEVDGEIAALQERQDALRRANTAAAGEAENALLDDPERAGALAVTIHGREAALQGLDGRIAEGRARREGIEQHYRDLTPDGARQPDGTLLFDPLTTGTLEERAHADRKAAIRLREQAATDPLGEHPPARPPEPLSETELQWSGLAAALLKGPATTEPAVRNPFGYAPGTLGAEIATRPRRRR